MKQSSYDMFPPNVWSFGFESKEWGSIQMFRYWKFSSSSALNTVFAPDHLFVFSFLWLFTDATLKGPFGTVEISLELSGSKVRSKVQFKCLDFENYQGHRSKYRSSAWSFIWPEWFIELKKVYRFEEFEAFDWSPSVGRINIFYFSGINTTSFHAKTSNIKTVLETAVSILLTLIQDNSNCTWKVFSARSIIIQFWKWWGVILFVQDEIGSI